MSKKKQYKGEDLAPKALIKWMKKAGKITPVQYMKQQKKR